MVIHTHTRPSKHWIFALLFLVVATFFGCTGKGECPGKLDCPCDETQLCEGKLTCTDGTCKAPDGVDAGDTDGGGKPDTGDPVDAGEPQEARCQAGTLACRCQASDKCVSGLRCESGICQTCNEGTAGCACKGGKTCNSGLRCESGVCLGCVGKANCPCYGSGHCDSGFKCEYADNGANSCKSCKGETGCNCDKDSDCGGTMLCANKRCTPKDAANKIPKNPLCYSTCNDNVKMPDGTIKPCHAEFKLKEGCGAGETCHEGSCLTEKEVKELNSSSYPFCASDANCPSWQGCVEGRCYSTCASTSECPNGFQCHMYVCRRECNVRTKPCDNKYTCSTKGKEDGICMPLPTTKSPSAPQNLTSGTFVVPYPSIRLTQNAVNQQIFFINKSEFATDFSLSRALDSTGAKRPLSWLKFDVCKTYSADGKSCEAFAGKPSLEEPLAIKQVQPGQMIIVQISGGDAKPSSISAYLGTIKIKGEQIGTQDVTVEYREKLDGHWRGTMLAFGNFDDTEIAKIRDKNVDLRSFKNAFLRQWVNFKRNVIDTPKMAALIESMKEGSWDFQRVRNNCKNAFSAVASLDVVCYPYNSAKGYEIFSNSQREAAIPSGSAELNFAINIKETSSNTLTGRIDTSKTLHYPGNPTISFSFDDGLTAKDKVFMQSMDATIDIGGRYYVDDSTACSDPTNFSKSTIPWMVPGFALMSYDRPGSLFRDRFDCRAQTVPKALPPGATDAEKTALREYNKSLSRSNPIPNGWRLRRKLQLVDGVLLNGDEMLIIYKETFVSFFNSADQKKSALDNDFVNYGLISLKRTSHEVQDDDYKGSAATTLKTCTSDSSCGGNLVCRGNICRPPSKLNQVACTSDIVKAAVGTTISNTSSLRSWSTTNLKSLISALMGNQPAAVTDNTSLQIKRQESGGDVEYSYTKDSTKHYIHYYCEDTKQFNGGPTNSATDCPPGSRIIFFDSTISESDMRAQRCNLDGSCDTRLPELRTIPGYRENVPFRCVDKTSAFCETNRKDMREGKIFFKPSSNTFVSSLQPLRNALFEAFRYRIKFQSRSGKNVGFTPKLCSQVAKSQTPYCYDPKVIEQLEQRVNCLEAIYADTTILNKLDGTTKASVKDYLAHAFAFSNRKVNGVIFTDPGFETLNAELKVMLGDESFTRSFASRYDLANTNLVSFQGSLLEPNGIDVSGALGYEMYNLYLSTQYYQMVLDRFFSTSNLLHQTFANRSSSFVTSASVTSYFQKLLLASTRKARSWSQIAKRYHALNRADLAKHVVERAYAATFMEMTILTRLLRELMKVLDANQIDQLTSEIKKVALTYKSSLLDMQETYKKLSLDADQFGFQKGYIPFPAMDKISALTNGTNAFAVALRFAQEKLAIAKNKEQIALQTKRQFDTSAAQFQSELVRIQQNYEGQLSELCGNIEIVDADGQKRLVPAIPKYAQLSSKTRNMGDPCGMLQGSQIYETLAQLDKFRINIESIKKMGERVLEKIELEKARVDKYCKDKLELADITWTAENEKQTLQKKITNLQNHIQRIARVGHAMIQVAELVKCNTVIQTNPLDGFSGGDCPQAKFSGGIILVMSALSEGAAVVTQLTIAKKQKELQEVQKKLQVTNIQFECNACDAGDSSCEKIGTAQFESDSRIRSLASELVGLEYNALQLEYTFQTIAGDLRRQLQLSRRLMTQLDETTQLTINVQAAQNDPNTRIYKNDAIITAEGTFEEAMKEAYRTTLIYEYYTGQTYARRGELYLIRMISAGDKNLEAYLSQLEQAFREFEEQNGKPDIRVLALSLRDDILRIPRIDDQHKTLVLNDRIALLQKILSDRNRLNRDGYTSIPFSLSVALGDSAVSPITFNHKILYVEAEIKSTAKGDDVARLYLRQKGTGMVRQSNGELKYYPLPQTTAVISPFFNGLKFFAPNVYRNFRLRDRPLGNTQWELLINQVSEKANQDIDLNSTSDILLYIYYSDFTKEN